MKAYLMHDHQDFNLHGALPANAQHLVQDLELDTIVNAMAGGDEFVAGVAHQAILCTLTDPQAIRYRQDVIRDALNHPDVVRDIYALTVAAIDGKRKSYHFISSHNPESTLHSSITVLEGFVVQLRKLRDLARDHQQEFRSTGFVRLFQMLSTELDDAYFDEVEAHLHTLRFRDGVLVSADLAHGFKGANYTVRRRNRPEHGWFRRLIPSARAAQTIRIAERDEAGARALSELRGRGINHAADALARSTDHILSFFEMLRTEVGFYLGCLNLHKQLTARRAPLCFPEPASPGTPVFRTEDLQDACLCLTMQSHVIGNEVAADGKSLMMITGANEGGKSTFLRSVGLAQLMMQCGMFVAAQAFRVDVRDAIFTHFKREEDETLRSGKLDEELGRMSAIADAITAGSVLLCNESFASTNEREGSEIARQIIRACLDAGIKVVFVTHLYDLAHGLYVQRLDAAAFLRAERQEDGSRSFKLAQGEPLPTSYGEDLYNRVFIHDSSDSVAAAPNSSP